VPLTVKLSAEDAVNACDAVEAKDAVVAVLALPINVAVSVDLFSHLAAVVS